MALYPRQNSRHLIMRPTKKTTLGVRAGLSFTSFRLRYSLRTCPITIQRIRYLKGQLFICNVH